MKVTWFKSTYYDFWISWIDSWLVCIAFFEDTIDILKTSAIFNEISFSTTDGSQIF